MPGPAHNRVVTTLSPAQEEQLRDAIRRAIDQVPGVYAGPVMGPLIDELAPVVASMLGTPDPDDAVATAVLDDAPAPVSEAPQETVDPAETAGGPLLVAFNSEDAGDKIVVREVESLDVELTEWNDYGDTLRTADVLVAFGDVSPERLRELTHWAFHEIEEDLVGYAGPPSLDNLALDGIEGVIASQVARTGQSRENFLPPGRS